MHDHKNASPLLMAQGYLQTFEAFSPQPYLLDSAWKFLGKVSQKDNSSFLQEQIRYYYLKNDFSQVALLSKDIDSKTINDAWFAYRIGEGNYQVSNFSRAKEFYQRAVDLKSSDPEFSNKLGSTLMVLKEVPQAKGIFQKIVDDNPEFAPALSNLGYVYFLQGDFEYAASLYDKALALDPDYEQAMMNKIGLLMLQHKNEEVQKLVNRVLKINPQNEKAKLILKQMHA
jgi:tetratricopeptide (TPR) repeat protein